MGRNEDAISDLNRAWHAHKLTIVVGAGVSVGSGLPVWSGLLNNILDKYIDLKYSEEPFVFFKNEIKDRLSKEFSYQSPLSFAHYIQSQLEREEFIKILHDSLYTGFSSEPDPSPIAKSIAALGAKLHSILSFNFDGLIEIALKREGYPYKPLWLANQLQSLEKETLPVYHPHGYLPFNLKPGERYDVVFAETDYHTQYSSQFSWNNVITVRELLTNTCLFVGASLTDPNQRRLLDYIYRQNPSAKHYFIWRVPDTKGRGGTDQLLQSIYNKMFEGAFSLLALTPLYANEWDEVPGILDSIRTIR